MSVEAGEGHVVSESNPDEQFKLVLQGLQDSNPLVLAQIRDVLISEFDLSDAQVAQILQNAPTVVATAPTASALGALSNALSKAGGEVLIVAPVPAEENASAIEIDQSQWTTAEQAAQAKMKENTVEPVAEKKPITLELDLSEYTPQKAAPDPAPTPKPAGNWDLGLSIDSGETEPEPPPVIQAQQPVVEAQIEPEIIVAPAPVEPEPVLSAPTVSASPLTLELENPDPKPVAPEPVESAAAAPKSQIELSSAEQSAPAETSNSASAEAPAAPSGPELSLADLQKKKRENPPPPPPQEASEENAEEVGDEGEAEEAHDESPQTGLKKHAHLLTKDIIIAIVAGMAILAGVNWFWLGSGDQVDSAEQTRRAVATATKAQEKTKAPKVEKAKEKPAVNVPIKESGKQATEQIELSWWLTRLESRLHEITFELSTPKPADLTPEEIVSGKSIPIWIWKIEIDPLSFESVTDGIYSATPPARVYTEQNGKRERLAGTSKIDIKFDAEKNAFVGTVNVDRTAVSGGIELHLSAAMEHVIQAEETAE